MRAIHTHTTQASGDSSCLRFSSPLEQNHFLLLFPLARSFKNDLHSAPVFLFASPSRSFKKNALLQFCFFFSFYASKSILLLLLHVPNSIMFSTLPCAKFHSFFFLFLPCAKFHSQKLSTPGLPRGRRKFSTPSLSRGKHFLFIFNSLIIIFFKKIHLILDYLNIL